MRFTELTFVAMALAASAAVAQDEAPAPDDPQTLETFPVAEEPAEQPPGEPVTLDAIEVTAQRRTQRLVDVPLAVTAITQDQVEGRGIHRLDDLNSLAPGLQVSRSPANTTISQLTIRGSSQINPAIYWDPAVGVYLDGVYIGKAQGSIFDIVDIASIEALRGPQGTLYGRNTIAGTVNFRTREPSGHFLGSAGVEYGEFGGQVYRASLDLPRLAIADISLGVRAERRDPWIATTAGSPVDGLNDRHNEGAHASVVLDLAQGLEAMYHLDYSKTDQTSQFLQLYRSDDANLAPYVSRKRRDTAAINAPSTEFADVEGHSLTLGWDATDWLSIKSISGLRRVTWIDQLDLDGTPEDLAHSMRDTDYEQKSQDLNVSGQLGTLHYTAGGYYFEDDGFTNNPIYVEIYLNGVRTPFDFDSRYGTHSEAQAVYGQLDWNPIEPLTLSAGVRRTTEKKDLDRVFGWRTGTAPLPPGPYTYLMEEGYKTDGVTFTATTPMAAAALRVNQNLNTYVRYAEGFKSGGYNGEFSDFLQGDEASNKAETNTPFRPEKQKSIEFGAKTSFMDGKALVNVAAFSNKLDDLQASIFIATGAAATIVRNAGKATVRGFEVEAALIPFEGTTVRLNYAWLDPHYVEFIDNDCRGQPKVCTEGNFADNRAFVHAPRNSYNAVVDSELWHTRWGTLRAVADYVWTDAFYTYPYQLQPDPDTDAADRQQEAESSKVRAYGLLNGRLSFIGIPLGGSRLGEVALWGRNLLDEDAVNNYIDFGPSVFENLTVVNFVEPRVVGFAALLRW